MPFVARSLFVFGVSWARNLSRFAIAAKTSPAISLICVDRESGIVVSRSYLFDGNGLPI